ncbi:diacylglycerol kinase family protein [Candidatus Roizmanbacteria bacterium]|nr:diacylglycerol kinase family protein [Candidatus Roizmanbacteria bacterium]
MIKKHAFSFKNALSGILWSLKTQTNFRTALFLSLLSIAGGFVFQIAKIEFLIILAMIAVGLAIETINTAIEEAIDAIHKDWSDEIKVAKDVSAAAMLIFSVMAFIIACIIFIPKIITL